MACGRLVCASPRLVVEFGGDAERLTARIVIARQVTATSGEITLNALTSETNAASVYGQVRLGLGSRVTITPGTRVDRWSLTRSTTASPWMNAEVRLSDRTRLRGGSGIYRNFPTWTRCYGLHGAGGTCSPSAPCTSTPASSTPAAPNAAALQRLHTPRTGRALDAGRGTAPIIDRRHRGGRVQRAMGEHAQW